MKVEKANDEMWMFHQLLLEDVRAARDFGLSVKSRFALRTLYRTSAAYIEGVTYQLRLVCLAALEDVPDIFDANEIMLLREKSVGLDYKGRIKERDSFQSLKSNILFLFRCFGKLHKLDFEPNTSDHRWASLGEFIEIRNSLMHPKSIEDFEMTEIKNKVSLEAVEWFHENLKRLYRECETADIAST
ncbi:MULTISPECIES: hypothetical protein [Vibrio]|uniref:hypothetical protein n=1 Tax=Vibrio TaxID=662 RepID=UPI0004F3ABDD|nr:MULTISPECIES: hypothetical protein [Vibrio]ELC9557897.1 hypothetical protein [Vibrio alginolyticus]MBE8571981.1 hypothetical protein [Vibrio sp. OPT46]MCA2422667.1 hypothetical protein [Vibrio alginolyticus]MCA2447278.1 hypothetical protein [Vibrio alginolyticus]MDW2067413.1 hypothetical protein [Vibrio sp. 1579]